MAISLSTKKGARRALLAVWLLVAVITSLGYWYIWPSGIALWLSYLLVALAFPLIVLEPDRHVSRPFLLRPYLWLWSGSLVTAYHAVDMQVPGGYGLLSAVGLVLLCSVVILTWVRKRMRE